jgi:hypothetical protein
MGTLLWRWKFALSLAANEISAARVDTNALMSALGIRNSGGADLSKLFAHFTGRLPEPSELTPLSNFIKENPPGQAPGSAGLIGLLICTPAFQRY